jgi:YidC/Oxa1 family membrane protein insertase
MNASLGIFATPLGWLLNFIYTLVGQYGLAIIIFTVLVRLCLFPLYATQIKSSLRMQELQPKIKNLQNKYANDKQLMQQKMMEFYKEEGYNPMRGCLPLVIQMPILMGLFMLLRNPAAFLGANSPMIMGAHEGFFWVNDLGTPDPWILPIAAGLTTFATYSVSQMGMDMPGGQNQAAGMMKVMKFVFPILIFWMAKSFPAGLALYWFTGNLFMMGQTRLLHIWRDRKKREKAREELKKKRKRVIPYRVRREVI